MRADFGDVVFRKAEPTKWSCFWSDYLGFLSFALAIASLVLFEYMAKRLLFDIPNYDYGLGSLGIGALLLGMAGLLRAALRRQFAPISLLGVLGSCATIYWVIIIFALALQR